MKTTRRRLFGGLLAGVGFGASAKAKTPKTVIRKPTQAGHWASLQVYEDLAKEPIREIPEPNERGNCNVCGQPWHNYSEEYVGRGGIQGARFGHKCSDLRVEQGIFIRSEAQLDKPFVSKARRVVEE